MKVYLSVDMEGITGLVDAEDVQPPGRDYERGRVMMTEDANAAVRGAYDAGATAVLVNDAHGPMRNLLPDLLDPRATLIKGRPKPMGMIEGLTSEYDAALCVGFHARAGVLGVLSHSFMGHEYRGHLARRPGHRRDRPPPRRVRRVRRTGRGVDR